MKLPRIFTGLAPALAMAVFIGLAAPGAVGAGQRRRRPPPAAPQPPPRPRRARCAAAAAPARPAAPPSCSASVPREMHRQFRRHGLGADLGRARPDDDHPGPRPLLRRHGQQEERRRHRDDQLRHHRAGHGDLLRPHLQPVVHRRQRLHRRLLARLPAGHPLRPDERGNNPNPLAPTIPETVYMCSR